MIRDEDLGIGAVFPIGDENKAFEQYFTGECYLNMLSTNGVTKGYNKIYEAISL
ncbi:hypothetical protein [Clostridioides sp. ZZV15-6383]|uniref:hypothetical protein n=1 Tax=Clostridioides sp. ZZV15-6383 TaxID=2811498 RepID=UPI001D0FED75